MRSRTNLVRMTFNYFHIIMYITCWASLRTLSNPTHPWYTSSTPGYWMLVRHLSSTTSSTSSSPSNLFTQPPSVLGNNINDSVIRFCCRGLKVCLKWFGGYSAHGTLTQYTFLWIQSLDFLGTFLGPGYTAVRYRVNGPAGAQLYNKNFFVNQAG